MIRNEKEKKIEMLNVIKYVCKLNNVDSNK
jgi:hypothetical protein